MAKKTPLFDTHLAEGARMVEFAGYEMPLHYGSQLEEHHAVRRAAGVFDVSHMGIIDLAGAGARDYLRRLLANDVDRLRAPGRALYSCLLNEQGHVLDDLIVYWQGPAAYRLVVNAGTRDKDLAWMRAHAGPDVSLIERTDLAMLAIQGPRARELTIALLPPGSRPLAQGLPAFAAAQIGEWFLARTGYTGEDGFELMLPAGEAVATWQALRRAGAAAVGLGARDTLRLEAGMNLYGNDMDESHHPLESGLAWTVAFDAAIPGEAARPFIGRAALEALRSQPHPLLRGLLLEERGVLRAHQAIATSAGPGEITSGGFSPTLNRSIALARLPAQATSPVSVDIRGKACMARIVTPPFVRHGQARISLEEREP
ncbi:MAG: glycine cleavage system aminomethyltransferase GcvT [Steroidobacteraceae bacterium]